MISVKDILSAVRFKSGDPHGTTISDFDILDAIDYAVKKIFMTGASRHMNFALKKATILVNNCDEGAILNTAPLPFGFLRVHKVYDSQGREMIYRPGHSPRAPTPGEYRIRAYEFTAAVGSYMLEYFCLPPRVMDAKGMLDVHRSLETIIADVASVLLKEGEPAATILTGSLLSQMVAQEVSGYEDRGPVQVWGGRA
jgi:hypothetical protein